MDSNEQRALATIALAAAFADGARGDQERAELQRIAEALQVGPGINMAQLVREVLLGRVDLAAEAARLSSPQFKQIAFEFAVGVCDADGLRNDAETRFLAELGQALGLAQPQIVETAVAADAIVTAPLAARAAPSQPTSGGPATAPPDLDRLILDASITNGALELLPQTLATLAILAVQMRMVYRIGVAHGVELDRGHVKDFLAAAGVGLAGQYLEQVGRRLVGGLFGAAAGRLVGAIASGATGAGFSFATTYALGQLARRYYAGGRAMSGELLRQTYASLLAEGRALVDRHLPQMQQRAQTLDGERIAALAKAEE